MSLQQRLNDECAIIPLDGRLIFTVPSQPLVSAPSPATNRQRFPRWILMIALVLGFWSLPTVTHAAVTPSGVIEAINTIRSAAGLTPLRHDDRLDQSATLKATDMFGQQYFGHQSPSGQRGWHWMIAAGYDYTEAGENLAMDFSVSQDVVDAWMTSAAHRENIIGSQYTDVGVATVAGTLSGKQTVVIVAHVGRQTSSATTAVTSVSRTPVDVPVATAPVVTSLPAPIDKVAAAPTLVPSIVSGVGQPIPDLVFTYTTPVVATPQVLGLSSAPEEALQQLPVADEIGWLILGALGLSASVIGLASVVWPSIYPQPLLRVTTI